jgi:thioredoxin 1
VSGKVEELTEKDFVLTTKKGIALVDFSAKWCHGCKLVEPHLTDLAKIWNDKVKFYKVDVTKNPGLAARLGVMSLPNILIFEGGKVREQIIGTTTKKAIEDRIKKIAK